MKNLLLTLGTEIVRGLLAAQAGDRSSIFSALFSPAPTPAAAEPAPLPDFAYLTAEAKRLFSYLALSFFASLFVVGGLLMAIYSAAQSVDFAGVFVASRTYSVSLLVAALGGVALLVSVRKLRRFEFSFERFFRRVTTVESSAVPPQAYAPGADELLSTPADTAAYLGEPSATTAAFARTGIAPEVLQHDLRASPERMAG